MIENRTAGYRRKKRRHSLLTSDGPFPGKHNILQFYSGAGRGELLDSLSMHVQNCNEPVVVCGEPGSGKTMLGLVLADRMNKKFSIIRYDFPTLSRDALLSFLLREIRPGLSSGVQPVNRYVTELHGDEADRASPEDSSLVALASAVRNAKRPVQPILLIVDTPAEIDENFQSLVEDLNSIRLHDYPLFSVVVFQTSQSPASLHAGTEKSAPQETSWPWKTWTLGRLSLSEIHEYLQHHMMLFDYNQRNMFTREMSYFIADRSEGVFGLINELARSAFLLAGINNSSKVSLTHLVAVSSPQPARSRRIPGLGSVSLSGIVFAIFVTGIVVLAATMVMMSGN